MRTRLLTFENLRKIMGLETIQSKVIRQQDGSDVVGYPAMLRSS
jgi:hypothetical protein